VGACVKVILVFSDLSLIEGLIRAVVCVFRISIVVTRQLFMPAQQTNVAT
jgi:hypothetical protein